jgi:hypothetical protein
MGRWIAICGRPFVRMTDMSIPTPPPDADGSRICATIPAEASFLSVLRAVGERAAHLSDFSQEGADDVSLVIDEVALVLMETSPTVLHLGTTIAVPGETKLTAHLRVDAQQASRRPDPETSTSWHVIVALTEKVWLIDDKTGIGIEFRHR